MGRRSDIKPLPSLERLRELLSYDEATGVLTWKTQLVTSRSTVGFNNKCGGKIAGTINPDGYVVIGIRKKYYLAHRIVWKLMTGEDPVDQIDHEDADRGNNRWANLRPASNGPNIQNSKLRTDNTSGVKGVHWDAHHKKWRAVITTNGKSQRLGRFSSIEEATNVICTARMQQHGAFARLN